MTDVPDTHESAHNTDAAAEQTLFVTPRVAILPFENLSADPAEDYFCEGIAAEILIDLARMPGLSVVARSSVSALTGDDRDVMVVGALLNATGIVQGSVWKSEGRLRISVELRDVPDGTVIWSRKYDRDVLDVCMVQDDVAAGIADALHVRQRENRGRKMQAVHSSIVDAYECYLQGRAHYTQYSRPSVEAACKCFLDAIEADADYGLAYCGLADCYSYLYLYVSASDANYDAADRASSRALEIDPKLAEAYASRGVILSLRGASEASDSAFEKAIALDPQLYEARFLYGRAAFSQGKLEKAARLFEEANACRPEDYQALFLAGQAMDDLGHKEHAAALRRRGVAVAERSLVLNPRETRALYLGANGLVFLGEKKKALAWLAQALAIEPDEPMLLYNAGCIYALVGDGESALDCLEKAVVAGLRQWGWYAHDSNLDAVRHHPRFQLLLSELV